MTHTTNFSPEGVHYESQATYDHIANWIHPEFPYSPKDGWGRFGLLGVLGNMILPTIPGTCIVEIGTGESSIYLTQLARIHNRRIFYCDEARGKISNPMTVKGYLHEDTVLVTGTPAQSDYINKQAVAYHGTSDNFFNNIHIPMVGLAFIDGEHHYDFVKRDFENIFNLLVPDGYIFLHDTYPSSEDLVLGDYCADSYRVRQELEKDPRVDVFTFTRVVGCNVGLCMVRKKPKGLPYYRQ